MNRQQLEDALIRAHEAGDTDAAELFAAELKSLPAMGSNPRKTAAAPAGAAGAPDDGGRPEGPTRQRDYIAAALTAPAKGVAGPLDLGFALGGAAAKKIGLGDHDDQGLSIGRWIDENFTTPMAGRQVERSVPLAMMEGAIQGPMGGGRAAVGAAAGAAAGGTAELLTDAPWYLQAPAALAAALITGKATGAALNGKDATLAGGKLREATKGISPDELRAGQGMMDEARLHDVDLLPSQTLDEGSGLARLQAAMMGSKAKGAEGLVARARGIPTKVGELIEGLRKASGQTPRDDALLAGDIKRTAELVRKSETTAVNQATKPLYQAIDSQTPLSPGWIKYRQKQFNTMLDEAIAGAKAAGETSDTVAGLEAAKKEINTFFDAGGKRQLTPEGLHNALRNVRDKLPNYTRLDGSTDNRTRELVGKAISYLQERADNVSPSMAQARQMQAELRSNLSGEFDDISRMAKRTGGAGPALDAAGKSGRIIEATMGTGKDRLAQELVQRRLNQVADKASTSSQPGTTAWKELKDQPGLDALYPGGNAGASVDRLRSVLNTAKAGDRSTGFPLPTEGEAGVARTLWSQIGQAAGLVITKLAGAGLRVRDEAVIRILQQPDAMNRIAQLKALPPERITPAALIAIFPELSQEIEK